MSVKSNSALRTFSRSFASMLSSGMPMLEALRLLRNQTHDRKLKTVVTRIAISVESGSTLSDSMSRFPLVFNELYVNMVKSGESSGKLPETIKRMADILDTNAKLRRRIRSAMMYPLIVLCIALAISLFLILFVLPVFRSVFESFKCELPRPTQFLLDLSFWVRAYGLYAAIVIAAVLVAVRKWHSTSLGAYARDRFVYSMPVFGDLSQKLAAAHFARTYGQLIRSGVPIVAAVAIAADATGNKVIRRAVLNARKPVDQGNPLSTALAEQKAFPELFIEMLQAGEKTGRVDDMMDCIADAYDEEVNAMLDGLTALLQPLLVILLGIIIGTMVICLLLPLFKMPAIIDF